MNDDPERCPACGGEREPIPGVGFVCLSETCSASLAVVAPVAVPPEAPAAPEPIERIVMDLYADGNGEINGGGCGALVVATALARASAAAMAMVTKLRIERIVAAGRN